MSRVWSSIFMVVVLMVGVTRAEDAEEGEEGGEEAEMASMVAELDTDKDGALSLAEILKSVNEEASEEGEDKEKLIATVTEKFATHDANKNDKLEAGEWKSFIQSFGDDDM
eukprot:TRINITY_DN66158_c0_g1_i1.p2 TRINITY_DN66158_c0_g1~~TRINITY_DN66158_c0_g1_i1.p2  ORF type:complete len:111 (+),score=44.52 TRINITY_DN66158_c0_g1_i1:73-405(+)